MAIRENDTKVTRNMGAYKRAAGVYKSKEDLEHVIRALKDANYNMDRVSLLARNLDNVEGADEIVHERTEGNEAKEGAGIGATTGTLLGGVTGFLIGVGLLAIPGVGPILAAGAEIGALGSTLAGAGIGAATGGIVGALIGLGIPEKKAKVYEERIKAGDYLLIVSGENDGDLNRVESIMRDRNVEEFEVFDATDSYRDDDGQYYSRREPTPPAWDTSSTGKAGVVGTNTDAARHPTGTGYASKTQVGNTDADVVIVDKRNERDRR